MAELKGTNAREWVTTISALSAAAVVFGQLVFGAGGGTGQFGAQLANLTDQVTRLSAKIDAGPRADQIVALGQIISAMGGRMDSLDARVRDSENRIAAIRAQLDLIDQSSRAALGKK